MGIDADAYLVMLTDSVTIEMPTISKTGIKDPVVSYSDRATSVACKLTRLSGYLAETILGRFPSSTHIGYFLGSQTIEVNDRIVDGTDYYEVINVAYPDDHHKEAILEKQKKGAIS